MKYQVKRDRKPIYGTIDLPPSKSESNRLLIIQALSENDADLSNLSDSDDTRVLQQALNLIDQKSNETIDVGHAGTSFRFLTAFLSIQDKRNFILTGSDRMKKRPCGPLVEALVAIGADIEYLGETGYPPLKITGKDQLKSEVDIRGDISSQFISSLMLIAPKLKAGLKINITSELVSRPYLEMTASLMRIFGAQVELSHASIHISPESYVMKNHTVESDWSAASYWYEMIALYGGELTLNGLKPESLQGDFQVKEIYKSFGVKTTFGKNTCVIQSVHEATPDKFEYDFTLVPDLAQTLMATCAGKKINALLTGLSTLKIKETDRIEAMAKELRKFNASLTTTKDSVEIKSGEYQRTDQVIETYHDHRMAMSIAPLAGIFDPLLIDDPMVVTKSYPNFWEHLKSVDFEVVGL